MVHPMLPAMRVHLPVQRSSCNDTTHILRTVIMLVQGGFKVVSQDSSRVLPQAGAGQGEPSPSTSASTPPPAAAQESGPNRACQTVSVQDSDVFLSFVESEAAPQAAALASALRERGLTVGTSTGEPLAGRLSVMMARVLVVLATGG